MFLQCLDSNWQSAVHGVGDYEHECFWAGLGDSGYEVVDYSCVDLEEIWSCMSQGRFIGGKVSLPSRVIPGLRAIPAGITTISEPLRAFVRPSLSGKNPLTLAGVSMWLRSIATPGA